MKDLVRKLLGELDGASGGTKAIAALVGAALVAVVGLAAVVANEPDLQLAFSGLSEHELPKVTRALAEASIPFEVSQPPAPFNVYVDGDERSAAYSAAYGAGALDKPLKGILSDTGVASVFHSAEERQQGVRKREWEEMEKMLEVLDFVVSARVRTSPRTSSPIAARHAPPTTASVTLRLAGERALSDEQATTVANLVSRGLGVAREDLVISDQGGISLYDGTEEEGEDRDVRELLAHQTDFEQRTNERANAVLRDILGPDKARVTITSEWDYDQQTTRTETPVGKGTLVSETKNSTERPIADALGALGAAGVSTNVAAADPADAPTEEAPEREPQLEKTSDERREYRPTLSTEEKVRFVPELERLSVALFLDQSIDAAQVQGLEEAVKAAVGFDVERDEFHSVVLPFFAEAEPAEEQTPEVAAPVEETSPLVEKLIERGIEVAVAVVFLSLLLRSLRGSSRAATEASAPQAVAAEDEIDPELLARAQIEELLRSDPERVGEILSSWARGGSRPVSGARS